MRVAALVEDQVLPDDPVLVGIEQAAPLGAGDQVVNLGADALAGGYSFGQGVGPPS
ncbi:MAG: hypothetical protein AB1673_06730 [Actinomycetota bacterium]